MIGEHQQAGGVDIEPTVRDPATAADFRQLAEYRAPAFRIITRDEFAGAFLVNQHARRHGLPLHRDRPTVDADTVTGIDLLTGNRRLAVDDDTTVVDNALLLASRSDPPRRPNFMRSFPPGTSSRPSSRRTTVAKGN